MKYCDQITTVRTEGYRIEQRIKAGERNLRWKLQALQDKQWYLYKQAAEDFAALNGWRRGRWFCAVMLARGGTHSIYKDRSDDYHMPHALFDHPLFFRERARPYRTAAIVGQPYNTPPEEARALALRLGLELHAPPNLTASWWLPGATRFYCLTRPGTQVRFLPEQGVANRSEQEHPY